MKITTKTMSEKHTKIQLDQDDLLLAIGSYINAERAREAKMGVEISWDDLDWSIAQADPAVVITIVEIKHDQT